MPNNLPSKSIELSGEAGSIYALLRAAVEESPEILTGVAAEVHPSLGRAIRLFHGAVKGSFLRQFAVELEEFRKKGKIKDDYLNSTQAKDCLLDLLAFIDRETPDSARLDAARKVFLNAATEKFSTRLDPLPQQLLQLTMSLRSGELLILAAISGPNAKSRNVTTSAMEWPRDVATATGLKSEELVSLHEQKLIEKLLIYPRAYNDASGITWGTKDRLTGLGVTLCQFIATQP